MTEAAAIARARGPVTQARLAVDFRRIGVEPGMTVLVHTAMSRIGWICGGARSVIEALLQVVGPEGTIVMPAQSSDLSDPAGWCDPPVPQTWWDTIRASMPAFDPRTTSTRGVGTVAETFRTWPGTLRSLHPQVSFTARGPRAADILSSQPLEDPFGVVSPLAVLNQCGAYVLMIGTGWETCTALHLAERLSDPHGPTFEDGTALLVDEERRWVRFRMPQTNVERFPVLGAKLDGQAMLHHGHVGAAPSRLFPVAQAVDTAVEMWSLPPLMT